MMHRLFASVFCFGFGSLALATGAQASTAITTQWNDTTLSQSECLKRAETAIRRGGFDSLAHTQESRHGVRGDYSVSIRCMAEKGVVFFVVAGPSRDRTPKYMDDVFKEF